MNLLYVRIGFVLISALLGSQVLGQILPWDMPIRLVLGAGAGALLVLFEAVVHKIGHVSVRGFSAAVFGLLFGLIMATSGCPVLSFLKPMAHYHLPFANSQETIVRSVSFYFLRKYFDWKRGVDVDFSLTDLDQYYNEIQKVNQGLSKRINSVVVSGDANQNAITILDALAKMLGFALKGELSEIEPLFK